MTITNVYCLAASAAEADQIVRGLHADGIDQERISVLLPDRREAREFVHEKSSKAPEGAAAGAGSGVVIGGILGWIAGIGALAIPGIGPFIAAGPILAAMSGAALGAVAGGIAGALIGLGIPESEARHYQSRIEDGLILIAVEASKPGEIARIRATFVRHHAQDISQAAINSDHTAVAW